MVEEERANWFQHRYEITRMKLAKEGPESLPSSPTHSLKNKSERRPEFSSGHSSEVSNSNRKQRSKPRTRRCLSGSEKSNQPTSTPPPFGVPPSFVGITSARSKSIKKKAPIYGKQIPATSPISVASSTGSIKSAVVAYDLDGFISPQGVWYGGFLSWLFRLGYHTISNDQNNNKLRLAAGLEGHGKTLIEDFNKILGSTHYAKPKVIEDAAKMLKSVAKTAEKLAGDKPCIASIGYSLASKLMGTMDLKIVVNISCTNQFLV